MLRGEAGAGAPPSAGASRLPCVSSLLRATRFASMSVELHKCKLGASSHYNTPVVLKAQGHPTLGKEREDTRAPEHTSVAVHKHTCTHGTSIWRCAPRGTCLFRQENITAPVPAAESFLFFSLGFWSYFWFAKIAPLEAAFLIGGIVSP